MICNYALNCTVMYALFILCNAIVYCNVTYTVCMLQLILADMYPLHSLLTAGLPIVISQQNCCLPSIQNIKAHLLPKENKSMCVNVSWNEVPGDCHIMQWKLDMLEWDGIPSYDFADDGNKTNNFIVVNRSWRKICGLTKTKYYQFQLSTTVKPHNTSLKFGSYTYFFGNKSSECIGRTHAFYCIYTSYYVLHVV